MIDGKVSYRLAANQVALSRPAREVQEPTDMVILIQCGEQARSFVAWKIKSREWNEFAELFG